MQCDLPFSPGRLLFFWSGTAHVVTAVAREKRGLEAPRGPQRREWQVLGAWSCDPGSESWS